MCYAFLKAHALLSISPSIYIAFESLRATDLCGIVGQPVHQSTLAFAPVDLFTSIASFYDRDLNDPSAYEILRLEIPKNWTLFNYADLQ